MKPTEKQKKICEFCQGILRIWIYTNDINSPTHFVDIEDFTHAECFDEIIDEELIVILEVLLNIIRKYK